MYKIGWVAIKILNSPNFRVFCFVSIKRVYFLQWERTFDLLHWSFPWEKLLKLYFLLHYCYYSYIYNVLFACVWSKRWPHYYHVKVPILEQSCLHAIWPYKHFPQHYEPNDMSIVQNLLLIICNWIINILISSYSEKPFIQTNKMIDKLFHS